MDGGWTICSLVLYYKFAQLLINYTKREIKIIWTYVLLLQLMSLVEDLMQDMQDANKELQLKMKDLMTDVSDLISL